MKKIKRYYRGFTLIEMITTVTILGIVSLVALPVISNISSGFTNKKFENYGASLLAAGKLYADQSMEDLFGDADDGLKQYIPIPIYDLGKGKTEEKKRKLF